MVISGGEPVPVPVMHVPFVQVPLQGLLQPPQLVLLELVSTQVEPQSIWPATGQVQLLFVHVEPPVQA